MSRHSLASLHRFLSASLALCMLAASVVSAAPVAYATTAPATDTTSQAVAGAVVDASGTASAASGASDPLHLFAPTPAMTPTEGKAITISASAKEMVSKRTEHSRVYDNGDGTYVYQSSLSRMNYFDAKAKQFQPVDSTLSATTKDSKAVFKNTADAFALTLPSTSGSGEWVSIGSARGSLSYRPSVGATSSFAPPASSSNGSLAGTTKDTVDYSGAFGAAADLSYVSTSNGLKESIVLPRYTGATTFGFDLVTTNLTPTLESNGSISLLSAETTAPAFTIPAPTMTDSLVNAADEPAFSSKVHYDLSKTSAGWHFDVVADKAWLSDPARVYPVQIDPTVTYQNYGTFQANGYTAASDTFVSDAAPNTNYNASYDSGYGYQLKTGYYSGSGNNRTFVYPDVSDIYAWNTTSHVQIIGANMNMACFWRYDHGTGPVWYGPIRSGWGEGSTTWNNQPGFESYSSANITQGGRARFDITPFVQQWMDGTYSSFGIAFWGRGGTTADWTKMYARENASNYPVFECWFTTTPTTSIVSSSLPNGPAAGAPSVAWTYADAMSKPQKRAELQVCQTIGGTTYASTSTGAQTTAALPTPTGGWVDRTTYYARVQTVGDITGLPGDAPSNWTGWSQFTYRAPSQVTPSVSTTASAGWFSEVDTNGDGLNDAKDDTNISGRGSVNLTWSAATGATGYNVYLSDGNALRLVGTTTTTGWTSAGKGLYPTDTAIAALASSTTTNPYLAGTGLDLRDDPRPLYAKTVGSSMDASAAYAFKVVPYNAGGEAPISQIPTVAVGLDNRTVHLSDDPRHTAYDMGDLFHHTGNAYLERGSLELDVTDLAIASYGPEAALSRHYSSTTTSATAFAPGWRFNFEQSLVVTGSVATYTDASGDVHRFSYVTTPVASATGGNKYTSGSNTVHVFTGSSSLVVNGSIAGASVLVVGGGGGGYCNLAGGGGAGGVLTGTQNLSGTMPVTIGAGGAGNSFNGGNSVFGTRTALGGGRGASRDVVGQTAGVGGCGGGGAGIMPATAANQAAGAGTAGQGFAGGAGTTDLIVNSGGGGGGGAGGAGGSGTTNAGGKGGNGIQSSITGTATYYGGGGGGSSYYSYGSGGLGGGGRGEGGTGGSGSGSTAGAANTGGGGGGWGAGGSGIVVVSYPTPGTVSTWVAPNGFVGTFAQVSGGYTLTLKDRSVLSFDSSGRLTSECDAVGNTVTYDRSVPNHLLINAANFQQIDVSLTSAGKVKSASHTPLTYIGTRSVSYCNGAGYGGETSATVTYFPNDPDAYRAVYAYGTSGTSASKLVSIASPDFQWRTSPDGVTWTFGYDPASSKLSSWHLINTNDTFGTNSVAYSGSSAVVTTPWPGGTNQTASATYVFNPVGTIVSKTSKTTAPGTWTYGYSPTNVCTYESTPGGHTITRSLDSHDNVLTETDEANHTTSSIYDSLDRVVSSTDASGSTTTNTYTGADLTSEQRTLGGGAVSSTLYEYNDPHHLMTKKSEAIASGTSPAVTEYSNFALNGEPQTTIVRNVVLKVGDSGVDLTTTTSYDGFGNLLWETNPAGEWVAKANTYSISGHLLTSEVVTGTITTNTYNALGGVWDTQTTDGTKVINHAAQQQDPLGTVLSKTSYDGAGTSNVMATDVSVTDSAGKVIETDSLGSDGTTLSVSKAAYDAEGRVLGSWAPASPSSAFDDPHATVTVYDAEGHATSVRDSGATTPTITTYFPSGLINQINNADLSVVSRTYDAVGRQISETKSTATSTVGAVSTSMYDLGGRLVASTDANGAVTTYAYDLMGHQLSATSGGSNSSTNVYNTAGQVISSTDNDGITTAAIYDTAGRVTSSQVGANKPATTSSYDAAGRLTSQTDPSGKTIRYGYDAFSRTTDASETVGGVTIKDTRTTYDSLSRVASSNRVVGSALSENDYYSGGVVASATVSYGDTTSTVEFNKGSSTEGTRTTALSGTSLTRTASYDAANRETSSALSGALDLSDLRGFDSAGRMISQSGSGFGALGATYGYPDASGKKASENLSFTFGDGISSSFAYTSDGRLASIAGAGAGTYLYDPSGSVTTFTVGAASPTTETLGYSGGRLASLSVGTSSSIDTTYTYDSLGRRSAQRRVLETTPTTFAYYDSGQLKAYSSASGTSATYTYDALGQRTNSVVASASVITTTTYSYDGIALLSLSAARSDDTTWSITYLRTSAGRPYAGVHRSGNAATVFGVVTTDRGDVVELLDSNGAAFVDYRYDAWGRPLAATAQTTDLVDAATAAAITSAQVLRYAGYAYDSESGLYYCSARHYDPSTMQFITKDPAKADGEESAFQYCGGDPVGRSDPSGEAYMTFDGFHLKVFRYLGKKKGRDRYELKIDIRATTGKASIPWTQTNGPIPPGTWNLSVKEWRTNTGRAWAYAPLLGWYAGPLHPGSGTLNRKGDGKNFYLHSYTPSLQTFTSTLGCIRVDPWNMDAVRLETLRDANGNVPIFVSYSKAFHAKK